MDIYQKLEQLSEKRVTYFLENLDSLVWYGGSKKYFEELVQEIREAKDEHRENNSVYLEDELGDVFWDYLMLLQALKAEGKITSIDAVLQRSYNKFIERVGPDGSGGEGNWDEIKAGQKLRRKKEHEEKYGK
ncbi:nucleotide pyrophosphohydrolase [Candidatus Gracilibacteria bacterium]|nr:nucleotide pyrophosphohydrolase [Candidatus Gracilibacteria bacterium]